MLSTILSEAGWRVVALGEVTRISSGGTPSRSRPEYWGGDIPWITTSKIDNGIISDVDEHITAEGLSNCPSRIYPKGTLLMAMYGQGATRGRVAIAGIDAAINQACASIEPSGAVTTDYLYHYLAHHYLSIRQLSNIGNQANLNGNLIKSIRLVVPPLPEQRAIAAVLSTWDRAVEQISRLIEAKKKLKKGLMQQLLTGKLRFADHNGDWPRSHIGDLLKEEDRWVEWDDNSLYRLASVRRWNRGLFSREHLYGQQIKVKKLKTIRAGDFVISHIQGAYGAMALVPTNFDGAQMSDLYSVLVPRDEGSLDIRFFNYLSQAPRMRSKIYAACNGFFAERLRLNFSPRDFLRQTVRVPAGLEEQRRIADVLDAMTSEISLLERRLEAVRRQKKGLMQKLLTGQVRVKV